MEDFIRTMAVADARHQSSLTADQVEFFRQHGLLVIRNLINPGELAELQRQTLTLVERAAGELPDDPIVADTVYRNHEITGNRVPNRVEYVVDKSSACKGLMGHPFILRSVEALQGPNFVPTWDSMVFKFEGQGAAIDWHRDDDRTKVGERPIFNVDFYLDNSDLTNCLWAIPASNQWDDERAALDVKRRTGTAFDSAGAVPLPMQAGDVLLHDILLLHGSPPARSRLRRVVYFEFRAAEAELALGPHVPEYVPIKQQILLACIRHRQTLPYAAGEKAYTYRPAAPFAPKGSFLDPVSFRVPHSDYWRASAGSSQWEDRVPSST